ncbi:phosphatase PAP2 family protein [Tissierella creatinophila]|uniref:Undecaprenyl pyrophosphate phosphatase n=1 Tax=Tissierella creatinophila DSM 6911 TaxID=1123403 RepID=A0A1U7M462_TISCR|nr:phosphatase PAP2 family protein [Tissierella creatinophila]OLS02103.1 undecaprenyl pyrophosphate phosphatase [Tissierella creatinophila DSM 6911]
MKDNKKKTINIILLLIFLTFGMMVRNSTEGILFDTKLLEFLHKGTNPTLLKIMKGISYLGAEKFLVPIMLIIIVFNLIKKNIRESLFLLVNTLGSFTLNSLIKQVFQRTRPFDFSLVKQGGLSYPSGHAMVVMSMYLSIFYLLTRKEEDKNKQFLIGLIICIYIISMGISRMYLGVHWPTDIIGGYICGYLLYDISKKIIKE